MHNKKILLVAVMLMILLGAGCSQSSPLTMAATYTPFQPLPVPTKTKSSSYWLDASLPVKLLNEFKSPAGLMLTEKADSVDLRFQMVDTKKGIPWVYALVAPFPTVEDEISLDALKSAWDGSFITGFQDQPLLMSRETLAAFKLLWGQPADGAVKVIPSDQILDTAWQNRPALALIPFEELTPRWKVLRVDGQSPLDGEFQPDSYPLTVYYNWVGDENSLAVVNDPAIWEKPVSNWDRSKMTVLLMTGTTALVRGTAAKMDQNGSTYPGEKIRDWLQSADLLHISNEVSFYPKCPLGDPYSASLMFCSRPEYIDLFKYIGVDIIESTGNHLQDFGILPFVDTLAKYKENGWRYYAAGQKLDEARQPLLVEDHGNKLAFIGCNPSGPESVWATDGKPGVANCDYQQMIAKMQDLARQGYLPIVTLQYDEVYIPKATESQRRDFQLLSNGGAVIVSGSQAHFPQVFEFMGDHFIHYGLGNLFFDQMDYPVIGTRREFLDRHIFYDGRYISTEILTAVLEDYAQPRPMTAEERQQFLSEYFNYSGW